MLSRRQLPALALALGAVLPGRARAAYPDRPVRIIVPFAPGSGTDMIARVMSEGMARELGQPVIVDKRGAGTIIGNDVVAKSAPDGYTLLLGSFASRSCPAYSRSCPMPATRLSHR